MTIMYSNKKLNKRFLNKILVFFGDIMFLLVCYTLMVPNGVFGNRNPGKTCNPDNYYKPYVTVYTKIRGPAITVPSDPSNTFFDTSKISDKFICINGPVMLYHDVLYAPVNNARRFSSGDNEDLNDMKKRQIRTRQTPCIPGEDGIPPGFDCFYNGSGGGIPRIITAPLRPTTEAPVNRATTTRRAPLTTTRAPILSENICLFRNAELQVYDHKCFKLNQTPKETKMSIRRKRLTRVAKRQVIGQTIFGIKMLTTLDDYRIADIIQFGHPDYEIHKAGCVDPNANRISNSSIRGHSFAAIGTRDQWDFCYKKKSVDEEIFIRLHMENDPRDPKICLYEPGTNDRFDEYFDGKPAINFTWDKCPAMVSPPGTPPATNASDLHSFKPFSINNPSDLPGATKILTNPGSDPFDTLSGMMFPMSTKTGSSGRKGSKFVHSSQATLSQHCTKMPALDEAKCSGQNKTKNTCLFMEGALGIGNPVDDDPQIKTRRDAATLINKIFEKICVQVSSDLPPIVSNILLFYLDQARVAGTAIPMMKEDAWKFLLGDLQTCFRQAEPMEFIYDEDFENDNDQGVDSDPAQFLKRSLSASNSEKASDNLDLDFNDGSKHRKRHNIENITATNITNDTYNSADPQLGYKRHVYLNGLGLEFADEKVRRKRQSLGPSPSSLEKQTMPLPVQENGDDGGSVRLKRRNEFRGLGFTFMDELNRQIRQTDPTPAPGGTGPTPAPGGTGPTPAPGGTGPTPAPVGTGPTPAPVPAVFEKVSLPRAVREIEDGFGNGRDEEVPTAFPTNIRVVHTPASTRTRRQTSTGSGIELFYYIEAAELEFEFNLALDAHWKIFATVLGYCNKFYKARKAETFPRLYNSYFEDIFEPIEPTWTSPADNDALELVISELGDPTTELWLNSCLEASYIVSDSTTFRPPRPLTFIEGTDRVTNYFEEIPDPTHFLPGRAGRAFRRGDQAEDNAVDSDTGDMLKMQVALPPDPGCHWKCNDKQEDCHKVCAGKEKKGKSHKSVDIIHGPDGGKTIVDKPDEMDSDDEYHTLPNVKKQNQYDDDIDDDGTEPRLSRKIGRHNNTQHERHLKSEKGNPQNSMSSKGSNAAKIARTLEDKLKHSKHSEFIKYSSALHRKKNRYKNLRLENPQKDILKLDTNSHHDDPLLYEKNGEPVSDRHKQIIDAYKKFYKKQAYLSRSENKPEEHPFAKRVPRSDEPNLTPSSVTLSPEKQIGATTTMTTLTTTAPPVATTTLNVNQRIRRIASL